MYALDVDRLTVSYFDTHALDDVSVRLPVASLIGIIGPNGAGKSTFLKAILGLIPARIEHLRVLDQSLEAVRSRVAYVPQRSAIDWDFPVRVQDVVLMGCYPKLGLFKRPSKAQKAFAMECLERVGMADHAERQIGELSGGQQQRVFLARALAQEAELLLLDEPFVGIDVASEQMIIELLRTLRAEGRTIVVVHHDLHKAEDYFDTLMLLNKQLIAVGPPSDILTPEWLEPAYGLPLFEQRKEGQG
ncbi:metal ABC transporter ATP-binding protein [uncultured Exiguobacterium sp.]|uniref:metal ABC transporter ATP-binding protein n=1 Tax=uncultured Exiguobacterium sp. TaxID=202669 RepID=UPI0025E3F3F2|nr:metal ABC transporter ATP-binding protein [uncultured Exiguobacterium sp.]